MTQITENYVSFETAKLLKEKGFDEETRGYYPIKGDATGRLMFSSEYNHNHSQVQISAPTLQMAMKWLREEYNIFISISTWLRRDDGTVQYVYEIRNLNDKDFKTIAASSLKEFDSPEKASEAAIKHCLENLI